MCLIELTLDNCDPVWSGLSIQTVLDLHLELIWLLNATESGILHHTHERTMILE